MIGGETMQKIIKNTYEATYYLISGAKLVDARVRKIPIHKQARRGLAYEWIMTLDGVPYDAVRLWGLGRAVANVRDFQATRSKLKKAVKRLVNVKHD